MEFGCLSSKYDCRDYTLKTHRCELPEEFKLELNMPVKNQGSVSSCVAHAAASILEAHADPHKSLSTNFIYGLRKELFNQEGKGMTLRDACKILADYGSPEVSLCPGNTEVPEVYEIASKALMDDAVVKSAKEYRIKKYFLCCSIDDIKYAIYHYGPVLAAYKWYDDYSVVNGVLTGKRGGSPGGHAVVLYGWNKEGFLMQNSWGKYWGNAGKCIVPYSIKVREARCVVDADDTSELKEPKKNSFLNIVYRCVNTIVNFFKRLLQLDK